jgi:uncharacterized membrane protein
VRQPTPWILALLVSVLINGALAGFILHRTADGPSWRRAHERQMGASEAGPGRSGRFNMRAFIQALPETHRARAEARLRSEAPSIGELMRTAHETRLHAEQVLSSTPFDQEAAQVALEEMRTARIAVEAYIETMVIDLVSDLDPDARAQALRAGRQGPPHGAPGPGRNRRRPDRG